VLALVSRRWKIAPTQPELAKPKPSVTLRPEKDVTVIVTKR
jgi:hypothetical protein